MWKYLVPLGFILFLFVIDKAEAQVPCPYQNNTEEWRACNNAYVTTCGSMWMGSVQRRACDATFVQRYQAAQSVPSKVAPITPYQCPNSHPIKGNFTTYSGERCIYHVPGGQFYSRTKPEACYVTPADAVADGCRASLR